MKEQWLRFFQKPREIKKKMWRTLEKDILFGEKKYFRKSKIENGGKKKRRNQKEKKNWRGFTGRWKKRMKKGDWKETQRPCKKKERKGIFVFEKVFSKKKRRVNMRRVDEESDHQEGTYKERKHEESQNREKKKTRNIRLRMRKIKRKEIWTGRILVAKRDTLWKEIETERKWQKKTWKKQKI